MEPLDPRTFAASCLCLAVRRAARVVGRRYDEAFRDLGINNGQFTILMVVSADRSITMGRIAEELAMDRTTLTAALKPLERDGLVRTTTDPADRRARLISITAEGRALLEQAVPRWQEAQAELLATADLSDVDQFHAALRSMA